MPAWVFIAEASLTVLDPQSPGARSIFNLGVLTLTICALIFAIVVGIIFYSLMRFRGREGEADPKQSAGNKTLELIWTAIPLLIVLLLFSLTVRTMSSADPAPPADPDLIVTGHQWWWEVKYPKSGIITANEIHIPVGKPFSVRLNSTDVLHEFWVAELTRKMTTVPGHGNHVWLQADKPGTYSGVCSEFCGTQHAWMRFLVIAEEPGQYDKWLKSQTQIAPAPESDQAAKGLALFQKMSCIECHAVNNPATGATVAPDLTHFASRRQLGAGIAENTPANLRRWLQNPQDVKPGVLMPDFKLTAEQLNELVDYFETLK